MTSRTLLSAPSLIVFAGLIILVGSLARLYEVDRMVVWHDEVFTAMRAFGYEQAQIADVLFSGRVLTPAVLLGFQQPSPERGWGDTWSALVGHPEHSPLYYLTARLAATLVREPLVALRGTSALLSLLLLPAIFWLARELFPANRRAAWIAAALVACSPLHLLYAQEAREYALWTAAVAASSAALLRALRRGRRGDWSLYAVLVAIGLYSHLLFILAMAAHGAYVLMATRRGPPTRRGLVRTWGVAAAFGMLLFSPWLLVVIEGSHRVEQVTAWMERPIAALRLLEEWGMHLVRVFADFPAAGPLLLLGLLPLGWLLWRFFRDAPARPRLFLGLLFAAFATAVLLPDLILGGSRSLHPRYLLPGFLAVELAVAYVLASGWDAPSEGQRLAVRLGLAATVGAGLLSGLLILEADTWWTKNFSAQNREVAQLINRVDRPLILVTDSGVGVGEIISLSYDLKDTATIWGEPRDRSAVPPKAHAAVFALTPSAELRADLKRGHRLTPLLSTWQWYEAKPADPPAEKTEAGHRPGDGAPREGLIGRSGASHAAGIRSPDGAERLVDERT